MQKILYVLLVIIIFYLITNQEHFGLGAITQLRPNYYPHLSTPFIWHNPTRNYYGGMWPYHTKYMWPYYRPYPHAIYRY